MTPAISSKIILDRFVMRDLSPEIAADILLDFPDAVPSDIKDFVKELRAEITPGPEALPAALASDGRFWGFWLGQLEDGTPAALAFGLDGSEVVLGHDGLPIPGWAPPISPSISDAKLALQADLERRLSAGVIIHSVGPLLEGVHEVAEAARRMQPRWIDALGRERLISPAEWEYLRGPARSPETAPSPRGFYQYIRAAFAALRRFPRGQRRSGHTDTCETCSRSLSKMPPVDLPADPCRGMRTDE